MHSLLLFSVQFLSQKMVIEKKLNDCWLITYNDTEDYPAELSEQHSSPSAIFVSFSVTSHAKRYPVIIKFHTGRKNQSPQLLLMCRKKYGIHMNHVHFSIGFSLTVTIGRCRNDLEVGGGGLSRSNSQPMCIL